MASVRPYWHLSRSPRWSAGQSAGFSGWGSPSSALISRHAFIGVPQDFGQAVALQRHAAEQGLAAAQSNLGLLYKNGQGVPQDYQQAVFWFQKAAEQGEINAEVNLAWQYASGLGVPKDHTKAVTWYRKAADQGDKQAQAYIAREQQHIPQSGATQKTDDALDAAVGDCLDHHIATGQFFLIEPTTGQLNLKRSSLRVIVSCEGPVTAWINSCEKETGNAEGCTRMSETITQNLLKDAWNHRSNLKKWGDR